MPKCGGRQCPELQLCDPRTGSCVPNKCANQSCVMNFVCVDGQCVVDTCPMVQCPDGYKCVTNPIDGSHSCDAPKVPVTMQDKIVGAGSGGLAFGCDVAPGSSSSRGAHLALLAVALFALRLRRRGSRQTS
jgi:MYXO-CTERM domain-containing protein